MNIHRIIQLALKETVPDLNLSTAIDKMGGIRCQRKPVSASRFSGDCHPIQQNVFRKLGSDSHSGAMIDGHIPEGNVFAVRHIGGRIVSRMVAKDDHMARRIPIKGFHTTGALQGNLHQSFLQFLPDPIVGMGLCSKAHLIRAF